MAFPSPTKTYHTEAYPTIDLLRPELSTKGKNVVITGGGSGIGAFIAPAFAQSGASNIALLGRTELSLLKTKKAIEEEYPLTRVSIYVADLVNEGALKKALQDFASKVGLIHILIANAGFLPASGSLEKLDLDEWNAGFDINVKGNLYLLRAFLPHAVENATVINVTTGAAHLPPFEGFAGYGLSKLAGAKLFEYLQQERPNFTVINVQPGVIPTAMNKKSKMDLPQDNVNLPAHFMVWAASPEAQFLKGKLVWANWDVDELKAMKAEIEGTNKFTLGLHGWVQ